MDVEQALERLVAAADDGRLAAVCEQHGVQLVTAFGSAVRDARAARDLDIAVLFADRQALAPLDVVGALIDLSGTDAVDLMVLDDAPPIARVNGLVGALPLYERERGTYARTQMAASLELYDTAWLRRAELERMAAG